MGFILIFAIGYFFIDLIVRYCKKRYAEQISLFIKTNLK